MSAEEPHSKLVRLCLSWFVLSTEMKSFVATVLAAVFCISHVDGSVSSVRSVEKRQVPLPPVRVSTCSSTELQRRNDAFACENP